MAIISNPNINFHSESMHLHHVKKSTSKLEQCQVNADYFCFFLNIIINEGLVHHAYAPKDQIISKEYYLKVMKRPLTIQYYYVI